MKRFTFAALIISLMVIFSGCNGKGSPNKNSQTAIDTTAVPDTGFTGIKKYMGNRRLIKEITFKNGVREGLMKSFYPGGQLRQTFWYVNGLREDSSKWFYEEGQIFRSTPYKNDTIEGTQVQYYKNGKLKAKLSYIKGLRTPYLEEFTKEGKLVTQYPEIVIKIQDEYKSKGSYRISMELSNKSQKVSFYQGDFSNGVFDTAHCKKLKTINGICNLNLKKTGSPKSNYVGIIADIITDFGNSALVYKKVDLPYNDLK